MKRREFLKGTMMSATLPFWLQSCDWANSDFPIHLHSDHGAGHLLMKSQNWPTVHIDKVELAIVGGGISGLSAAYANKNKGYLLFELSDRLGGASGAQVYDGIQFSQGAHYDLAYPEYYGEEVLKFLEELKVIHYQPWKKSWSFTDEKHLIPFQRRQKCFEDGLFRSDVMPSGKFKQQFVELLAQYDGYMPLPTRLASDEMKELDGLTFLEFLSKELNIDAHTKRRLDYHMKDDYGAGADVVSAFAGIHYFMCRPYYTSSVDLFSPPNGNAYFLDKISQHLDTQNLRTDHLVRKIEKTGEEFRLEILDINQKRILKLSAEQVVYAGQKHALKYIYPEQAKLFNHETAPWIMVNLVCKEEALEYGTWQNEFLGENPAYLGFIDSSVQSKEQMKDYRVYSSYYCLTPKDRKYLTTVGEHKEDIVSETQGYIEQFLGKKLKTETAFINVMGHAMPIPKPGYLFKDANVHQDATMAYAGVDNGRLPLLFEAIDSGLMTH